MPPMPALKTDSRQRRPTEIIGRVLFGLFVAQWLFVWTRLCLEQRPFGSGRWPEALLLILTAATTLVTLSHEIPWQNVLVASAIIALMSMLSRRLALLTGIPPGLLANTGEPWPVPLVWLVASLNSRAIARLLAARWRKSASYGVWLMGLTALLAAFFGFGLGSWEQSQPALDSFRESLPASLWWAFTALLALIVATPWLINKRPVEQPPEHQPLIIWLMLNLLFVTAAAVQRRWIIVAVSLSGNLALTVLARRRI